MKKYINASASKPKKYVGDLLEELTGIRLEKSKSDFIQSPFGFKFRYDLTNTINGYNKSKYKVRIQIDGDTIDANNFQELVNHARELSYTKITSTGYPYDCKTNYTFGNGYQISIDVPRTEKDFEEGSWK